MTRSLGRRSGAVLVLTALFGVIPASPAGAEPVITIDQPRDAQTVETASVTFTGKVTNNAPVMAVKDVTLSLGEQAGPTHRCRESPCTFS